MGTSSWLSVVTSQYQKAFITAYPAALARVEVDQRVRASVNLPPGTVGALCKIWERASRTVHCLAAVRFPALGDRRSLSNSPGRAHVALPPPFPPRCIAIMGLSLRAKTDEERQLRALEKAAAREAKAQQKAAKQQQKAAEKRQKAAAGERKAAEKAAEGERRAAEKRQRQLRQQAEKDGRRREKHAQKEARELARRAEKELAALEKQARKAGDRMRAAEKRARRDEKKERKARKREARRAERQLRASRRSNRRGPPGPPKFAKKRHCHACARAFTVARRRHHCRLCRSSCCLACVAATRRPLPTFNRARPQIVCVVCDVLHFEQGEVASTPPPAEARGVAPPPPAIQGTAATPAEPLAAPIVALAVNRSARRPNSAPLPSTSPDAAPVTRPPTSAPVVRVKKPKRAQSSKWLGGLLKRKHSLTLRSWGSSAPVGRQRLDVHLAKTAELLAQASSRAIELRAERPELAVAV